MNDATVNKASEVVEDDSIATDVLNVPSAPNVHEKIRLAFANRRILRQDNRIIESNIAQYQHNHLEITELSTSCSDHQFEIKLKDVIIAITSSNGRKQSEGVIELRKLLSGQIPISLAPTISYNLIPILMKWLRNISNEHLQSVGAWAISCLAKSSTTLLDCILDYNIIPSLINLMYAETTNVVDRGIMALGVLAGCSPRARDEVIRWNVVKAILYLARNPNLDFFMYEFVCLILRLCSHTEPLNLFHIRPILPYLAELLAINDTQVVYIICSTFWYITRYEETNAFALLDTSAVQSLTKLLQESDSNFINDIALRCIGNIIIFDGEIANRFIRYGGLSQLKQLLNKKNQDKTIIREIMWILSNLITRHLQAILDTGLLLILKSFLNNDDDAIKNESLWLIANIFCSNSEYSILLIVHEHKILKILCDLLDSAKYSLNNDTIKNILLVFWALLSNEHIKKDMPLYCRDILNADGLQNLIKLQNFKYDITYKCIMDILLEASK